MLDGNPLIDRIPEEVPLPNAPLVRVVAQVRFPTLTAVERPDALAPFQEALSSRYPILREEKSRGVVLSPAGMIQSAFETQVMWRFAANPKSGDGWTLALTRDFLALETQKYTSRRDFLERFSEAVKALDVTFHPSMMDRLGVRYIDRIAGDDAKDVRKLITPHVLGILGLPIGDHIQQHALTDTIFTLDGAGLRARWGRLPKKATPDPSAIEPIEEDSWILDLDAFTQEPTSFEVNSVVAKAEEFAKRIYAVFRWAVTDDFLQRFGGRI